MKPPLQNLSSSLCQPTVLPSPGWVLSRKKPPWEPESQPKSGKTRLSGQMSWRFSWPQRLVERSAWGGAICCYASVGDGLSLPICHCSQPRQRLTSSSDPYTLTSVPWDVTEGWGAMERPWPGMSSMPGQNSAHQFPKTPACSTRPAFQDSSSAIRCVLRRELPQSCWEMIDRKTWEHPPSQYSSQRRLLVFPPQHSLLFSFFAHSFL